MVAAFGTIGWAKSGGGGRRVAAKWLFSRRFSARDLEVAMMFTGKVLQLLLASGGRTFGAFSRSLAKVIAQLVRAIQHRRDAQILARLDSKMLADIGLTQADVRDAFSEPLWRDPTGVLATRISERRSSRRRAIFDRPAGVARASSAETQASGASTYRPARSVG
jgi:uncharacterized protein YjiS (DUF1127 family)